MDVTSSPPDTEIDILVRRALGRTKESVEEICQELNVDINNSYEAIREVHNAIERPVLSTDRRVLQQGIIGVTGVFGDTKEAWTVLAIALRTYQFMISLRQSQQFPKRVFTAIKEVVKEAEWYEIIDIFSIHGDITNNGNTLNSRLFKMSKMAEIYREFGKDKLVFAKPLIEQGEGLSTIRDFINHNIDSDILQSIAETDLE